MDRKTGVCRLIDNTGNIFYAPMVTDLDVSWLKDSGGIFTVGTIGTADRDLDF